MTRKIIKIVDLTPYRGPTTMEELRAQTFKMKVPDPKVEHLKSIQRPKTFDRDLIVAMIEQGCSGKMISEATGASTSLISRIKSGER